VKYAVTVMGRTFDVEIRGTDVLVNGVGRPATLQAVPGTPLRQLVLPDATHTLALRRRSDGWTVLSGGETWDAVVLDERTRQLRDLTGGPGPRAGRVLVKAPMPGLVLRLEVAVGDAVRAGQGVVVLEAMKMENELKAPVAGRVAGIHAQAGQAVDKGAALVEVAAEA
jgi:biotin carboxyl carrier protein